MNLFFKSKLSKIKSLYCNLDVILLSDQILYYFLVRIKGNLLEIFLVKENGMKQDYLNQDEAKYPQKAAHYKRIFWVFAILFMVGGLSYYVYTYHPSFLSGNWVLLMFLLCPLMHFFMHNGHGGHGHK